MGLSAKTQTTGLEWWISGVDPMASTSTLIDKIHSFESIRTSGYGQVTDSRSVLVTLGRAPGTESKEDPSLKLSGKIKGDPEIAYLVCFIRLGPGPSGPQAQVGPGPSGPGGSESCQILPRLSGHSVKLPMENRILHGTVCKKSGGGPAKLFL